MKVRQVERFLKRMRKYSVEAKALKMEMSMKERASPMWQNIWRRGSRKRRPITEQQKFSCGISLIPITYTARREGIYGLDKSIF
jgi:hypothetical protein